MKVKKIQKAFALLRGGAALPSPGPAAAAAAAAIQLPDGLRVDLGVLIGRLRRGSSVILPPPFSFIWIIPIGA